MNATQPTPLRPVHSRPSHSPRLRHAKPHVGIAIETTAKLTIHSLLAIAAISGLVRLLPYHQKVQDRLVEVQTELQETEARVNHLQAEFFTSFDPQQAKQVMQEQSNRIDPQRRPIVWVEGRAVSNGENPVQSYLSANRKPNSLERR